MRIPMPHCGHNLRLLAVSATKRSRHLIAVVDVIGFRGIALQTRSVHANTIGVAGPFAASRALNVLVFSAESRASGSGGTKK
jgi:hypothetical protein